MRMNKSITFIPKTLFIIFNHSLSSNHNSKSASPLSHNTFQSTTNRSLPEKRRFLLTVLVGSVVPKHLPGYLKLCKVATIMTVMDWNKSLCCREAFTTTWNGSKWKEKRVFQIIPLLLRLLLYLKVYSRARIMSLMLVYH